MRKGQWRMLVGQMKTPLLSLWERWCFQRERESKSWIRKCIKDIKIQGHNTQAENAQKVIKGWNEIIEKNKGYKCSTVEQSQKPWRGFVHSWCNSTALCIKGTHTNLSYGVQFTCHYTVEWCLLQLYRELYKDWTKNHWDLMKDADQLHYGKWSVCGARSMPETASSAKSKSYNPCLLVGWLVGWL